MVKKTTKFAIPLNVSVSKEIYDRAQRLQMAWDKIALDKYEKRFRMSDLGELVWNVGLGVLEELNRSQVTDTIAKDEVNKELIKVEVRKAKRALKTPKSLSDLTDNEVDNMTKGGEQSDNSD